MDLREDGASRIDNQIDVLSKTFLGLTVACARCHDHKFDAITTKDYYALNGMLASSRHSLAFIDPTAKNASKIAELQAIRDQLARRYEGPAAAERPKAEPSSDIVFEDFTVRPYAGWFSNATPSGRVRRSLMRGGSKAIR